MKRSRVSRLLLTLDDLKPVILWSTAIMGSDVSSAFSGRRRTSMRKISLHRVRRRRPALSAGARHRRLQKYSAGEGHHQPLTVWAEVLAEDHTEGQREDQGDGGRILRLYAERRTARATPSARHATAPGV